MKTADWDDPTIRAIGRRYAADAYDLASELHNYGADAAALLKPHDPMRPRDVCLPAMLADVVMAVLLTLPRPDWAPDQPLAENVTALRKRWIPTRSATPSTALVPQRKVGFPIRNPRLLLGFQGTKSARREGISSPFSDAGGCTSPQNSGGIRLAPLCSQPPFGRKARTLTDT